MRDAADSGERETGRVECSKLDSPAQGSLLEKSPFVDY
jgi:hypothetical protein